MKLNPIRKYFGLRWPSKYPQLNYMDWVVGLMFVSIMLLVLALVTYIGDNVKLADNNARAVYRADHAELVLVACLNNKPILDGNTAIFCEPLRYDL